MGEGSEHAARLLRAYQAQEKRFVERRFPLQFAPEVPALRELYSQAKGLHWNPETEIAWDRFDATRYPAATREAARRTWSRRAWSVYPGLTESTALLIRFCLESGSIGMDAKLFLSLRPAEEAKCWPLGDPIERLKDHLILNGEWDEARHTQAQDRRLSCVQVATCHEPSG